MTVDAWLRILMRLTIALLFIVFTIASFGCEESFYDSIKLTTAVDHIGHISSTVDLAWTLHQHKFDKAILAGCRPSCLYPGKEDTPEEIERLNKVILAIQDRKPGLIFALPLIRTDDPDPIATAKRYLIGRKGFGLSLHPSEGQDLFSPQMRKLYSECELARAPIVLHIGADRFFDLQTIARDYSHLILIVPQLAGLYDRLSDLDSLLWRYNNIYLGLGFGPEEILIERIEALSKNLPALRSFIKDHKERVCFATETNLTEEPYRNGNFAESLVRFMRRFLEKDKADLKIKDRSGKWIERSFPGLSLDKQILGFIYRHNALRALSKTQPRMDVANLDLIVPGLPKGTKFDPASDLRLLPAVVTNVNLPLSGLSSTQLKKLLGGSLTDFNAFSKASGKVEIVSRGPVAQWVAKRLRVENIGQIKRIDNPTAFVNYMASSKNAIGLCTFEDLDYRMKCLTVDGEAPTISYVKYCAAKGAGTYGHYFDTYPLLIPVSVPKGISRTYFNPHELRRIVLSGPMKMGAFDPGRDKNVTAQRRTNEVAPYLRDAGLTVIGFNKPIRNGCNSNDCTAADFLPGVLATGMDAFVYDKKDMDDMMAGHSIVRLTPGHPIERDVRGMRMTVVGGSCGVEDADILIENVRKAKAGGGLVAAALGCSKEDFSKLSPVLEKAGAAVVTNVLATSIQPWKITRHGVITPGLGPSFVNKNEEGDGVLLVLTFYKNRFISIDPIMVSSTMGITRRLAGSWAIDALKKVIQPAS